jgi:hypothetical protein
MMAASSLLKPTIILHNTYYQTIGWIWKGPHPRSLPLFGTAGS